MGDGMLLLSTRHDFSDPDMAHVWSQPTKPNARGRSRGGERFHSQALAIVAGYLGLNSQRLFIGK
jgi:hypothetical protein